MVFVYHKVMNMKIIINSTISLVILLLLSGCTSKHSKELVSTYAKSTNSVTIKTQELFQDIKSTRLNSKSLVLLTKGSAVSVNELKFKEINSVGINQTLSYLNDFSTALIELSDDSSNKSLSKAMNKLNGSLSNLNDTTEKSLDNDDIVNISSLVFSIGSSYLDSKKYDKLKEIIKVSEKSVTKKLYNLSEAILQFKSPYIRALKEERRRLLKVVNYPHHYYINKNNEEIRNTYLLKIDEHKELYKELVLLNKKIQLEPQRFELLSQTLKDTAKLHKKISISLDNDDELSFSKIKKDTYDIKTKLKNIKQFKKEIKE